MYLLLAELESSRLEVVLVPLKRPVNEGGMRRVCASRNPAWYRKLCAAHPSARGVRRGKPDTRIRRATILSVLGRLAAGKTSRSKYVAELLRIASAIPARREFAGRAG